MMESFKEFRAAVERDENEGNTKSLTVMLPESLYRALALERATNGRHMRRTIIDALLVEFKKGR